MTFKRANHRFDERLCQYHTHRVPPIDPKRRFDPTQWTQRENSFFERDTDRRTDAR